VSRGVPPDEQARLRLSVIGGARLGGAGSSCCLRLRGSESTRDLQKRFTPCASRRASPASGNQSLAERGFAPPGASVAFGWSVRVDARVRSFKRAAPSMRAARSRRGARAPDREPVPSPAADEADVGLDPQRAEDLGRTIREPVGWVAGVGEALLAQRGV